MSEKKRVIVLDDLAPEGVERLLGEGLAVESGAGWDEAELLRRVPGCHALVAGPGTPVTAAVLAAGGRLEVVGRAGVDVGDIDVSEATRRGIIVVHAPDSALVSEAEYALALVLACARGLAAVDADLRAGRARERWGGGVEVRGKTLGVVGAGPGSALLADRARALGMTVLVCDPREPAGGAAGAAGALELAEPARLYAEADFLLVQASGPAGASLGEEELGRLKAGARVISLAGPGVVDHAALTRALEGGAVAAAAVAVAAAGPAADPIIDAPNVVLTTRAEASTADARRRAGVSVAEQVAAVLQGRLLPGAVNVPAAAGDDAEELMPYMGLCAQLGRLLVQLAGERVDEVEITFGGSVAYFDTHLLTLGVLGGVLAGRAEVPVNFVNAEGIAADLGVRAIETRQSGIPDFPRLITVAGAAVSVAGTSLGPEHKPRLVRVFGEDVDIEPAAHMAFLRYVDAPGIGGKVGTRLGEWGVNIGHLSVGRGRLGDQAVMALTLDDALSADQIAELITACGLEDARAVEL